MISLLLILLKGSVALCQYYRKASGFLAYYLSCRTEVDELYVSVIAYVNVVGLYITVKDSCAMYYHQGIKCLIQYIQCLSLGESMPLGFYVTLKVNSLKIFHYKVCRVILIEKLVHTDDVWVTVESGDSLCFLVELLSTCLEVLASLVTVGCYCALTYVSVHKRIGSKLLNGNLLFVTQVVAKICDTKSALTQNPSHKILTEKYSSFLKCGGKSLCI